MDEQSDWRARRDHAVAQHAAAERRQRAVETERAMELVRRFAAEAGARGLRTVALTAFAYDGGGRYRTGLRGWYVHRNRTLAVTPDGTYYVLGVPSSLRARLLGAQVPPADPPLIVGRGARDGESMPLETLLRLRLDAGDDWP
ncbi:hypothetical protein [Catellatospora sp. NPDC049609]|uniref:hypothetical protein n=1 Tax=Catellatospora sp. NPDC049609 TaxID=3155505 RepID=UPI00342F2670